MFSHENLVKIMSQFSDNGSDKGKKWLRLVCGWKKTNNTIQRTGSRLPIELNIHGGSNESDNAYINLRDILTGNTKYEESAFLCVQTNGKLVCSNKSGSNKSGRPCDFCDKWTRDRVMFKQLINEMTNQMQVINIIELMKNNLHLFPAAILDNNQYHSFHTSLDAYRQKSKLIK